MNVFWPIRNSAKKPPPTSFQPSCTRDYRLSPLDLPEVLERIFSFLDNHSLATAAPLVCHGWHTISKRLLHIVADLDTFLDIEKRDIILAVLPKATRLILSSSSPNLQEVPLEIVRLAPLLQDKSRPQQEQQGSLSPMVPLQQLALGSGIGQVYILLALLPCSTFLTHLKLYNDRKLDIQLDLGTILCAYPHLVALDLTVCIDGNFRVLAPGSSLLEQDHVPTTEIPALLHLRSITLSHVHISVPTLQSLLRASATTLKDLNLWNLRIGVTSPNHPSDTEFSWQYDVPIFVDFLMGLELALRSVTLSIFEEDPSAELARLLQEKDVFRGLGLFLQEWGFPEVFFRHGLVQMIPNRITTLHVVRGRGWGGDESGSCSIGLHLFLCESPFLLHLRALGFYFSTDDLEAPPPSGESGKRKTWACEGLQTLQMTFYDPKEGRMSSPRSCRVAFGYLVRCCPRLKELEVGMVVGMNFELEEGWVVLSRLQSLERLKVWPVDRLNWKVVMNQLWAVIRPGRMDWIRQQNRMRNWRVDLVKDAVRIPGQDRYGSGILVHGGPNELVSSLWRDNQDLGTLWDVKMALGDVQQDTKLEKCWPRLYSLNLLYEGDGHHEYKERRIESRQPVRYTDKQKKLNVPLSW